ncbi:MAG: hypothetical protein P4M11_13655 [Candidatus Pacebacteria bacterium]|nr:hypothetical protein [Candidatus Paceibacterota bacterium]
MEKRKSPYQKMQELVPPEVRQKWALEQDTLKAQLITEDNIDWTTDLKNPVPGKKPLRLVLDSDQCEFHR